MDAERASAAEKNDFSEPIPRENTPLPRGCFSAFRQDHTMRDAVFQKRPMFSASRAPVIHNPAAPTANFAGYFQGF
jgi:hypothetical protein